MFLKRYKNLRQFKPYFKKHSTLIIALICVMVIASSLGMFLAWLISQQLIGITNMAASVIITFTVYILAAVLVYHICWFLWSRFATVLHNKVSRELSKEITEKMLNTKLETLKDNSSGFYAERLRDSVQQVSEFYPSVLGALVDVITNLSFLIIIFVLNWQCGLFFSVGIILLFLIESLRIKRDTNYLSKLTSIREKYNI